MIASFSCFSQGRTGTGGVLDNPKMDPISHHDRKGGGSIHEEDITLLNFERAINRQEVKCRSRGSQHLKNSDFMDIYLKLSVIHTTFVADELCQDVNTYFKCLSSLEVKIKLNAVLKEPKVKTHLMRKYSISEKEAVNMLSFFKTLDLSCEENDDCGM